MNKSFISFLIIVLMAFSGCTQNNKEVVSDKISATINVELNENSELIFDNQAADIDDFSKLVEKRVNELIIDGIPRDEIVVSFKAAKVVKMGLIADLQDELRQLDVRKVNYSNN